MSFDEKLYYDTARICSYNAIFNFLVGSRGLGKTFGFKKKAIRDNIKKGHEFIYVRRFKNELVTSKNTFFADIEYLFPDWDFRVMGNQAQRAPIETRDEKKREWFVMGYFVALSTGQTFKSVAFPKVRTIIFDEFIIEKGATHYLPDEANLFQNFYYTVNRNRDGKHITRVYFLANSVSIMNPYFIKYKIRPDNLPEISLSNKGFILVHFPDASDYAGAVGQTTWGRFIAGTEYEDYAVNNSFADAHDNLIDFKPPTARYHFTLESSIGMFAVWYDMRSGNYYAQSKRPGNELLFTLLPEKMDEGKVLMTFQDKPLGYLRSAFRQGRMFFDAPETRNKFSEIFKR